MNFHSVKSDKHIGALTSRRVRHSITNTHDEISACLEFKSLSGFAKNTAFSNIRNKVILPLHGQYEIQLRSGISKISSKLHLFSRLIENSLGKFKIGKLVILQSRRLPTSYSDSFPGYEVGRLQEFAPKK